MSLANRTLAAVACVTGLVLGALVALGGTEIGGAAVAGLAFGALLLMNLELGLAAWVALSLYEAVPAVEAAVKGATVLMFLVWLGAVVNRQALLTGLLRRHGRLVAAVLLLLVWLTMSITWSERPDTGVVLWQWYVAAAIFFMVATLVTEERHVRWVLVALVAGIVATAVIGFGGTPLGSGLPFLEAAVGNQDRLQGGVDDPNFFAVLLVVGLALAGALVLVVRRASARVGLPAVIVLLALGVVATQSRGGVVALAAGAASALVVFRGRRLPLLGFVLFVLAITGLAFSAAPTALERVTTVEGGGTGRSDIWKVAVAMAADRPVAGVGIGNFGVHSPRYVDDLGPLERTDLVAEKLLVVHSAYLELLAETGVVGLGLFVAVVLGGLSAAWRAARRFEALGRRSMSILASAVVVATVAFLAGATFVSTGYDERLWILLALGPAMLAMARRQDAQLQVPAAFELEGPAPVDRVPVLAGR